MPWLALGATNREIREGDTVVGSGPEADWRVASVDLTARHFVVRLQSGAAAIEACSPDNVVVLNGQQLVARSPVRDGETILAGSGRFSFSTARPKAAPVVEAPVEPGFLVDATDRMAHPLEGRSTPIGRDASNIVVIRDPTASRFHAEVRREAGGFAIHSMGAMGTLLNGYPVEHPTLLHDGDTIEIAFTKLRFTNETPTGVRLAAPHATRNDESAKRPTLEPVERVVVDDENPAGRHTRRVQVLVGLGILLAAILWWTLGRRA
jgi:predicted component of type VI protein secretion system